MSDYPAEMTEQDRDLGFGTRVADMSARRLLNHDGSFNTRRRGLGVLGYLSLYNTLLTMSWPALTGMDETFSQTVHARSSYKPDEVIWNARFEDVFNYAPGQGPISIDVGRIHNVERLEPAP
jgi:hypothetical protein